MYDTLLMSICFVTFRYLHERCCRSRVLHVMLQQESEIACICAGGFVYFVVNIMSYFFPFPF